MEKLKFRRINGPKWAIIFTVLALLTACQSTSNTIATLEVEPSTGDQATSSANEVIGSGETKIALALSFSQTNVSKSKAIRNGAELALEQLADGKLSIAVLNAKSPNLSKEIEGTSPKLIAFSGQPSLATNIANGAIRINLDADSFNNTNSNFAFQASDVGSLAAGINFGSGLTAGETVIVVEAGYPSQKLNWLKGAVNTQTKIVQLKKRQSAIQIIEQLKSIGTVGTIGFTAADNSVSSVVTELRKAAEGFTIVGHSKWPNSLIENAKLEGTLIAQTDNSGYNIIADRYKEKFGVAPPLAAMVGFDIVAICAGIIRVNGPDRINKESLIKASGFRGTTGAFRFKEDGSVERLFEITKIKSGQKIKIQNAPAGF